MCRSVYGTVSSEMALVISSITYTYIKYQVKQSTTKHVGRDRNLGTTLDSEKAR